ncbi:hypothetical protein Fmac_014985 [Flemingia macrophylla]|uniref:Uncharacterized protein n=1 Tax=Flemingia macrophylla TaxID=520843 RepID=A0ABD1MDD8_9FABA
MDRKLIGSCTNIGLKLSRMDLLRQEEGWVVCRAFKKRTNGQTKTIKGWDRSRLYDEQASIGVNSVVDPVNLVTRQQSQSFSAQNILYKKEMIEADSLSFMHADQLVQHPQLESPSLTLVKNKQTLVSTLVSNQEDWQQRLSNTKKVTDWRDLDKFVASQLSQEERHEIEGVSSFATHTCSDMPLLLLHNSRDNNEGNKLNPFLRTSSADCDIGICVFEN